MANFEHEMLAQELRGAKDAAAAMEAQLQRLHNENSSLRAGGGLRDELALATEQLKDALDAKLELQLALTSQVRRAQAETSAALVGLASADADLDAAAGVAQAHEEAAVAAVASGAAVTVICSTDDTYPELVPVFARAVKAAKPELKVIMAGLMPDYTEAFREAGVDDFIHLRANNLQMLQSLIAGEHA